MQTNTAGITLIKSFEGFSSSPYLCPGNVVTIGYGTTRYESGESVRLNDLPITELQAMCLLRKDLEIFEKQVLSVTRFKLTFNQFSSLVSFTYNLGYGNLRESTLLRKVNNNPNDKSIEDEFKRWIYAGGRILRGLERRSKPMQICILEIN